MKRIVLPVFLLTIVYALSGCSTSTPVVTESTTEPSIAVSVEAPNVEDQASLIAGHQSAGAVGEIGDSVKQDFFTPKGNIIKINGQDVQVFEYKNANVMESEASQVTPDGGSVGTSMMMWVDAPHFFKAGRILVLYIGTDTTVLDILDNVLGAQFAGR